MSLRSRRAACAVSSSASTTIRPPTMCSPPANRSMADTSALRQHGFVTCRRLSSSFTFAVIAMGAILPSGPTRPWPKVATNLTDGSGQDVPVCRGEAQLVMLAGVVGRRHGRDDEVGTEALADPAQQLLVGDHPR